MDQAWRFALWTGFRSQAYYSRTAVAWAVSISVKMMLKRVAPTCRKNHLDDRTYNKSTRRRKDLRESLQIDGQTREP